MLLDELSIGKVQLIRDQKRVSVHVPARNGKAEELLLEHCQPSECINAR